MIEYIKLFWEGAPEGEPSVILYEVDTGNERLALRSIDIFADGRTHNIPDLYDGAIEIAPIPTMEELNTHVWGEEFHACVIEKGLGLRGASPDCPPCIGRGAGVVPASGRDLVASPHRQLSIPRPSAHR